MSLIGNMTRPLSSGTKPQLRLITTRLASWLSGNETVWVARRSYYVAPANIPQFLHGLTDRAEHAERPEPVTSIVQPSTRLTVIKGGVGE